MRDWSLSEELYRSFHAWPVIVAFCLVGGLLGWAGTYLWPTSYRTQAQIFVGLNPYRAFEDAQFLALNKPEYTNIDDYKNWQMSQLSAAIFLDDIIKETLRALRENDEYWNGVSAAQLSDMLRAEWRTAGTWSLVAEGPDAKRTNQAVREWSRTALKRIKPAITTGQNAVLTDEKLQDVQKELLETSLYKETSLAAQTMLQEWADNDKTLPPNKPLEQADRLRLAYLVANLAKFTPAWTDLLASQPEADALPKDYAEWVDRALAAVAEELKATEQRLDLLEQESARLEKLYQNQIEDSYGLSPNLVIKDYEKFKPEIIRPTWQFIVLGSFGGLLAWVVYTLVNITRRGLRR